MTKQRFEQFKELYKEFVETCEKKVPFITDCYGRGNCYNLLHSDYWLLDEDGDPKCIGYDQDTGWLDDDIKAEWLWESDEQIKADIDEINQKAKITHLQSWRLVNDKQGRGIRMQEM